MREILSLMHLADACIGPTELLLFFQLCMLLLLYLCVCYLEVVLSYKAISNFCIGY